MKEERLKILEMIGEGKISAEEGAKLLEALKIGRDKGDYESPSFDERMNKFAKNVESFSKEVGDKMGVAYKNVEPKVKKATKVVVEKTAKVIDELSVKLNETLKNMEKSGEEDCCGNSESDFDNTPREN